MPILDPRDLDFRLADWEAEGRRERRRREEEQGRRNEAWREDERTRDRFREGLAPRYVSIPIPNPAPGEPVSKMVRQD